MGVFHRWVLCQKLQQLQAVSGCFFDQKVLDIF